MLERRNVLHRRRNEIAGVSGVGGGRGVEFPDEIGAGSTGFRCRNWRQKRRSGAVIQGKLLAQTPFILDIDAGFEGAVAAIVHDVDGLVGRLGAGDRIGGEDGGIGVRSFRGVIRQNPARIVC